MKKFFLFVPLVLVITWLTQCKKSSPEEQKEAIVYTIAGTGASGYSNGFGPNSKFYFPSDVAVQKDGTLYISDQINHRVRKLATNDEVSSYAGNGVKGNTSGNATEASFGEITCLTLDANGDIYLYDDSYAQVRKISAGLTVSSIAGAGTNGFVEGPANVAQFNQSRGIVTDGNGTIYMADNHRVRKIKNGIVSTVAGTGIPGFADGKASEAQFNQPRGITIDKQGSLYVCDNGNYSIRKITSTGIVSTLAGTGSAGANDGGPGIGSFIYPDRIAVDKSGNLYVTDGHKIRKIDRAGEVSTIAGTGEAGYQDGAARFAKFNYVAGIAIDAEGNIYVADSGNNRVRKIIFH